MFFSLKGPMARVCGPDTPYPVQLLEPAYLINPDRVMRIIRSVLQA
jgi:pyruvate/2-oxoglutarate/acetoin dehydrogenase E1 component